MLIEKPIYSYSIFTPICRISANPQTMGSIKIPSAGGGGGSRGGGGKKSGGGGGGGSSKSTTNTALENELKALEHKKAMDALTYSEELAWLKKIRSSYAKTAEEKQEQLYTAQSSCYLGDDWPICHDCIVEHCVHANCLGYNYGKYPDCRFLEMKKFYMSKDD